MRLREVRDLVERRPFRPFRICMSDGSVHLVTNPDHVFLTKHTVHVGVLEEGDDLPDHTIYCDTLHISRVETVAS